MTVPAGVAAAERTDGSPEDQPLVSVVIPFLNAEPFLSQAIQSVVAQTYGSWELLLVDDGSTDGSTRVAREHESADPDRIIYLEHDGHQNLGAGASRNLGVERASGDMIAFLDADDVYLPFKLERQVAALLAHPEAALLIANTLFWNAPDRGSTPQPIDFVPNLSPIGLEPERIYPPPALLILMLENEDTHPAICSVLVRREVFAEVGGFERPSCDQYEDSTFLVKAYRRYPVFVSGDCSAVYRLHGASSSQLATARGDYHPFAPNPVRGAFLDWAARYLEGFPPDVAVQRALAWELLPYRDPARYRRLQRSTQVLSGLARTPRLALGGGRALRDRSRQLARRWVTRR